MADAKISALTDGGGAAAGDAIPVDRAGANYRISPIGMSVLVYRYTVTGSDKASIDTGVDSPNAGSNDWTNGDFLEVWLYGRTDEAAVGSVVTALLNNDSLGHYDRVRLTGQNSAASSANLNATTGMSVTVAGDTAPAGVFGAASFEIPNFAGTVGNKVLKATISIPGQTVGTNEIDILTFGWRSTSAITRLSVAPATALKKFKVGSQLLIYKRLAS